MHKIIQEKYIISTGNHEDWRNYLIVNSFFFDVLIKDLREKLSIPIDGFQGVQEILEWESNKLKEARKTLANKSFGNKSGVKKAKEILSTEYKVRRLFYAPIWEVIEKFRDLELDFSLLHSFVLGHTNISSRGSSKVYMVTSPEDPIEETGVYIKYSPELSEKDMQILVKQATDSFQTLFNITHKSTRTHDNNGKSYIKRKVLEFRERKTIAPNERQLKFFKAIEKDLKENYSKRHNSIKMQDVFSRVAIETGVNKGSINRSYHALINNFNLPTSVDTKKISV